MEDLLGVDAGGKRLQSPPASASSLVQSVLCGTLRGGGGAGKERGGTPLSHPATGGDPRGSHALGVLAPYACVKVPVPWLGY